jgi:hypothetical protein
VVPNLFRITRNYEEDRGRLPVHNAPRAAL